MFCNKNLYARSVNSEMFKVVFFLAVLINLFLEIKTNQQCGKVNGNFSYEFPYRLYEYSYEDTQFPW